MGIPPKIATAREKRRSDGGGHLVLVRVLRRRRVGDEAKDEMYNHRGGTGICQRLRSGGRMDVPDDFGALLLGSGPF